MFKDNLPSLEQAFDSACPPYQDALHKSSYNYKLKFNPQHAKTKRTRNRNVSSDTPHMGTEVISMQVKFGVGSN